MYKSMTGVGEFVQAACIIVYVAGLLFAAWSDARTLEISNTVSIAIACAFVPAALLAGLDGAHLLDHGAVALSLLVGGAVLFWRQAFGGADVKLLAATGLWLGWGDVLPFLFIVAVCGGLLAVIVLVASRLSPVQRWLAPFGLPWLERGNGSGQPIPYGVAIAAGGLFMLPRLSAMPSILRDLFTG